jgi:hypothetical protein
MDAAGLALDFPLRLVGMRKIRRLDRRNANRPQAKEEEMN